jgi:hypothetical protein
VVAAADVVARAAAAAVTGAMADPGSQFHPIAIAIGEAWADEIVRSLRSVDREIVGAWPGTMREARTRVRVAFRTRLEVAVVDELARIAYFAARRGWQEVSAPDPES